ncbi:MAG: hydrogenobyrinic acid a,c-diamide synthase (glutamine-hydrolyzing) [Crenarchaeota archaeon]|nr:hydrogenobyrinic acid a,c-diamide synthase (glutamine-hydrolyzing) [Thermoproteota archaeon]HJJ21223.1 hydrogenobyrinic acid a,c-diamide synthase (glutamine-hydrolyzing) [Nitrosopumilus sp.]MDA0853574.1 hydrogenobyrinic acid a,c-diamide synthase (glutamine-hydrolyzing) [Thermoproteota archaeon]MDA1123214.1 hydrogenobyrinic acid a,c-diamide synthase (glutamine-hydrolyzing) [Thermoproteota archaeon]HJJ24189.1 hydrogenobyrinic acid a,c-diamide synthase (glutamine-hydrolyzing) [Nitrosopumilus sp
MKIKRIVLAGATSGVGKTSITCSIIYALQKKGFSVQPFKVGPDYIDPSYLTTISKNKTYNLDVWLMGQKQVLDSFVSHSNSDISIIEGVMGYYDGFEGNSNYASTHHVASITKSPVILILDASKTARSIGATALGFQKFHRNSRIVGIILNKIGSKKHEILCRDALEKTKLPIVGIIPKNPNLNLESRHLGLISTYDNKILKNKLEKTSKIISESLDVNGIIKILKNPISLSKNKPSASKNTKVKIAVALDNSFNFYYDDNLNALRRQGASLTFFSPIKDKRIPKCDGLYIGGGFPEILGHNLSKNQIMKKSIKKLSEDNFPIYAECGGLMYLTKSITNNEKKYKMVGLFDAETVMTKKMRLNYTKGKLSNRNILSDTLHGFRGHEFHYSQLESVASDSKFAFNLDIGEGIINHQDGIIQNNTLASYGHLYFDSSNYAEIFVKNCLNESRR